MGSVEESAPFHAGPTLEPIAICGMSCRTPGSGTSPSALWRMLLEKAAGNTTRVPQTRFNIDAHFHENMDRPGSMPCPGGYFLDGAPENFDPTFFNMTPVEAMWLDPQQRRMLEVCYEAIESAGLTLQSIAGTNTGVFAASFTADYQQMTFKDHDFRHNYAATGVDTGIISARIGNIFDLRGPNSLINTACSSSVYAVHNACNSLRSRDCDSAIVGGVNLILTVDQHMNTAKLGIMSPTSFCHTFDESADGYGRAEGAGALYLKRLDDALRDGDTVRAVIRSSAVNSNGKVPGYGITFPNSDGQEQVIRQAYRRAGLDPNDTAVFEVHGTGTPVGDPIEVRAVSKAMNDTRPRNKPLRLTAIKPNIGHSEAASGIFAIIKAALMVETGLLPGIAGLKNLSPNIHEDEWNVKVNKDLCAWPSGFTFRRASLSSFGYGGTNAHVILENVEGLVPGYKHGSPRKTADYDHTSTRPLLLTMSAHDKTTLHKNIEAYCNVADQFYLVDFAHTLNTKRSTFQQRAFALASEPTAATDLVPANFKLGSGSINGLAFIFTGQGAQWAGVAKEAIQTFPIFRETIRKLDQILKRLPHTPDFTLEEQLSAPAEISRINDPDVAQSTLTAVQIAVVDLLYSWGVTPKSTIGHSSGEVAAAYAAGLVSAPEAIVAAYYRGYCLVRYAQKGGSMLAVGKGADGLEPYRGRLGSNIVVACENSPNSVTLSGPINEIHAAREIFVSEQVFTRELRTGMAYHSPFMQSAADPMTVVVTEALDRLDGLDRLWQLPEKTMISTVTNKRLRRGDVTPSYWTLNLVSSVLFNTGVQTLVNDESFGDTNGFLEVGPHSALAGPFKQICQGNDYTYDYLPTIVRNEANSVVSLLRAAGDLYLASYPVDLVRVNRATSSDYDGLAKGYQKPHHIRPFPLVDLPSYQWNYDNVFWTEPRASAEYRQLTHPRHDLLGRRILGLSDHSISWRNVLRIKDIPWLVDHKLGGSVMFPAAAHLAAVFEAVRQHCEITHIDILGVTARDFVLKTALVIPETDAGIEIQVRLTEQVSAAENVRSYTFATESYSQGSGWVIHSEGTILANTDESETLSATHPVCMDELTQRHSGKRWNESFRRVGFEYGRAFATLDKVRTHGKYQHQAAGVIPIEVESGLMQGESRYILHPSTVDGLLQLVIIAIHAGLYQDMPWGVIPVSFDEVTLRFPGNAAGTEGHAVAWLPERGEHARRFISDAKLITESGEVVLDIKGMHTQSYEAALPPASDSVLGPSPYTGVVWQPDASINSPKSFLSNEETAASAVLKLIKSLNHKHPLGSLLVLDRQKLLGQTQILENTAPTTKVSLDNSVGTRNDAEGARVQKLVLPEGRLDISNIEMQDMVVFGPAESTQLLNSEEIPGLKSLLGEATVFILLTDKKQTIQLRDAIHGYGISVEAISLPDHDLLFRLPAIHTLNSTNKSNGHANGLKAKALDLVYSPDHSDRPEELANALRARGIQVQHRLLKDIGTGRTNQIILYNPDGSLLSHADEASFESLKTIVSSDTSTIWLTSGANEGECPAAGMVSGFLRVVREEQKMAKVLVLDYDKDETPGSISRAIDSVLGNTNTSQDDVTETELWLHNHICHISRILPNEELNTRVIGEKGPITTKRLSKGELLRGLHESGEIMFHSSDEFDTSFPADNELEVQVTHVLNFSKQDLQANSVKTSLVAGTVTKTGRAIHGDLKGAHILTYSHNPYDTLVRVCEDITVRYSPSKNDGLLAGLSQTLLTLQAAVTSLSEKRVLLLSPSPQLAKSATLLAKTYGFEVTISSDTLVQTKASQVLKGSHGPSLVVVTETFSSHSESVWRDLPAGATFVLDCNIQYADLKLLDARPFSRGARFVTTRIKDLLVSDPLSVRKSLETAISLIAQFDDQTLPEAITLATLADPATTAVDAPVLKFDYDRDQVKVLPSEFNISFSAEDVYLLVGCLGGLGRSLTSWMLDHGAKRFAFVSRSGDDKPEATRLIKNITEAGAVTEVFRADASSIADMKGVVSSITKHRRIRGVVHAAMVLNDSILPNMNLEKWKGTLHPKVDGALSLSEALWEHNDDLDFFVMTSSISAIAGQPGQSNYAAANSFLDSLALSRNIAGLPGTSLVLPMVLGVGVVAESDHLEVLISRRGQYGADEREMLRGFAAAMSQPRPQASKWAVKSASDPQSSAIIMGLEPARLAASLSAARDDDLSDVSWLENDARFNNLQSWIRAASGNVPGKAGASNAGAFVPLLYATANKDGYTAALDLVSEHIINKCSAILLVPADAMQLEGKSVGAHGLDSMIGVELRNWLFKELQLNIAFQDLLSQTLSFKGLSELVLKGLDIIPGTTIVEMEEEQRRARSGVKG